MLSERCHPNSLGHNFMFATLDRSDGSVRFCDEREPRRNAEMIMAAFAPLPLVEFNLGTPRRPDREGIGLAPPRRTGGRSAAGCRRGRSLDLRQRPRPGTPLVTSLGFAVALAHFPRAPLQPLSPSRPDHRATRDQQERSLGHRRRDLDRPDSHQSIAANRPLFATHRLPCTRERTRAKKRTSAGSARPRNPRRP